MQRAPDHSLEIAALDLASLEHKRINVRTLLAINGRLRALGFGVWALLVLLWLWLRRDALSSGALAAAVLGLLLCAGLWPVLARRYTPSRAHPLQAEHDALLIDAAIVGAWTAALGFPLWLCVMGYSMVLMSNTFYRGKFGAVEAALAIAIASLITLLLVDLPLSHWQHWQQAFAAQPLLQPGWAIVWDMLVLALFFGFLVNLALMVHRAWNQLRRSERCLLGNQAKLVHAWRELRDRYVHLREKIIRDDLTGLYNRSYFDDVLWRECKRIMRLQSSLAIFMVDIDHFKSINDRYGHLVGDKVLKRVAHLLLSSMREADVACRWGGEEFALMMPDISLEVALQRAEYCRLRVQELQIRHAGIAIRSTVSIGVALYPLHGAAVQALMAVADRCMYAAKASGRNLLGYENSAGQIVVLRLGQTQPSAAVGAAAQTSKGAADAPDAAHTAAPEHATTNVQRFYLGQQRDALTGLMTQLMFGQEGSKRLQQWMLRGQTGALFIVDIDAFEQVNDTLGYRCGDELIYQVAQRLAERQAYWSDALLARGMAGDSFSLLMAYAPQERRRESDRPALEQWINARMRELQGCMQARFVIGSNSLACTVSIGAVAAHVGDGEGVETLLRQANIALHEARRCGKGQVRIYQASMLQALRNRADIEADLQQAVPRQELRYLLQAQVDEAGQLIGAEALLRWQHSTRGMIMPSDFIALAEKSGDIYVMGDWMLRYTCDVLKRWAAHALLSTLTLSVNVSAHQLLHPGFVQDVQALAQDPKVPLQKLKFEITETMLIDDPEPVLEKMHLLQEMGLRFSLDDFGVGYSSLSYLRKLPIDEVKIDRSFVQHILHNERDAAIAATIIRLAKTFHLAVVAEGVESEAQRDALVNMGCRKFQGYFFAKPMSETQFERLADWLCLHETLHGEHPLHPPELPSSV